MAGAVPVFVGSRVLDPAEAERIVSTGQADIVGMTRATIVDPEMPNKAINGELQTITACLGCNQACIGHYHKGLAIGCVQNPMAGNEEKLRPLVQRSRTGKRVVVIGAGPAGLQAAVTASDLGHQVTLIDQTNAIGGLLRIMRRAPMRREVAETMLDNYTRKLSQSNVNVQLGQRATRHEIGKLEADVVICAAGARPYLPHVEGIDHPRLMLVDELFGANPRTVGRRVLVFDYFGDWPGVEAAIFLAEKGHDVTLVSARLYIGEEVHQYLRNEYLKKLYTLKVTLLPHFDFGGITQERVILRNLFTHEAEQIGDWDTIVLSMGRVPNTELYEEVKGSAPVVRQIGDCLAPRTLEEATFEGMMAALEI
jgi:thioredoxin reductase